MKVAILLGQPIPRLSLLSRSIISSPRGIAAILFISAYLIAILYCRQAFYRDPTSAFFDATRGYEKSYSLEREHQAEEYIQAANRLIQPHTASAEPVLCLGVATVSRPSKQYIRKTIGSLLADLTELERRKIHFILFIAHTDPHVHPIYGEKWVQTLPNTLLSYEANATELSRIKKWEDDKDYMPKGLYDYAYLLENCYKTGAPYIAMVEGDVLAVEGWFPRAIAAAEAVEDQAPWGGDTGSWLYIRMFFTETYMGWNREEWPRYLMWSILLLIVVNVCLVGARAVSPMFQRTNSNSTLVVVSFVCLPACILLYFFAGRISMQPLAPGVRPMENFGCCSQGFIFLRRMVPHILDRIRHPLAGYIDMLMEAVAETDKLGRWAIFPSLLQHIGGQSSKGDEVADSRAKMIWNFGFEMYKAATLRTGQ